MPHVWTKVTGQRGRFVGIVQTMASTGGIGYLEGDDQFRSDAQTWLPSQDTNTVVGPWNGTGTEDCFNSGWYFNAGPNALPVNADLVKEDGPGRIDCLRWFLNDAPDVPELAGRPDRARGGQRRRRHVLLVRRLLVCDRADTALVGYAPQPRQFSRLSLRTPI